MPCLDLCRIAAATIRARARASAWCICSSCSSSAPSWQQQQQQYTTSVQLIGKWQEILSNVKHEQHVNAPILQADNLRQLLNDAIHVYKTEGAAAVVPDQVTEVLLGVYSSLGSSQQRLTFFTLLAREFGVQGVAVDAAVQLWQDKGQAQHASPELLYRLADRLTAAAQPLYMQLMLPVSQHKAGIAFLVRLRSDLLQLLREQPGLPQGAALRALSRDLRSALARWFSVGLLQLQRITWEDSPGQLLERVMATEAVHRMQHLGELKRRLQQSDRRVFAFLHPSLHCEPLVVLHTAIMDHIPATMDAVLTAPQTQYTPASSPDRLNTEHQQQQHAAAAPAGHASPAAAAGGSSSAGAVQDTDSVEQQSRTAVTGSVACFYSISSGQPGLAGVDLGNFLIKKAAQHLLAELPQLQHLVTLSPIPGFRAWLITKLQADAAAAAVNSDGIDNSQDGGLGSHISQEQQLLRPHEAGTVLHLYQQLVQLKQQNQNQQCTSAPANSTSADPGSSSSSVTASSALLHIMQSNAWLQLPEEQQQALQPVLLRLCACYLLREKRRGVALDPVEHFHLKNGAWLWRINTRADLSAAGLERSCGLMVNYKYVLADVSANNRAYLVDHEIAAAEPLKQLLVA